MLTQTPLSNDQQLLLSCQVTSLCKNRTSDETHLSCQENTIAATPIINVAIFCNKIMTITLSNLHRMMTFHIIFLRFYLHFSRLSQLFGNGLWRLWNTVIHHRTISQSSWGCVHWVVLKSSWKPWDINGFHCLYFVSMIFSMNEQ